MAELTTALITGAGSGVGRAVAIQLGKLGWSLALVGRRESALQETAGMARAAGAVACHVVPCDIGSAEAVEAMWQRVISALGTVEVLVNAAGNNIPNRSLAQLSHADYQMMIGANLHGAYYCARVVLPGMRSRGSGTIVNVVSDAGKQASPKAGPSYVMAKFGVAGLTQSINAEERGNGIRACAVFPGDIDTPLLEKRPAPPSAEARARMLQPEDVAACVLLAIQLPPRVVIEEILVRPR